MQPQQSSANEYSFNPDSFEEDIFMLKKKNSKIKKYTLLLFKGALFVLKKTHFELNKVKTNNALGAKVFIPTKRLYISSVDYHFQFDGKEYIQVSLVSTLLFKRRNIDLLFDVKNLVNSFVQVFGKFTKYISIENEYTYIKDIGKGSFCQMKLARQNSNGLLYAVKKIKKDVHSIEEFTTLNWEKDIITFLKYIPESKNILKCYDIIETLDNLYIVMEYIAGGSLSSFIRKNNVCLPSSQVKEIVMQIANGLSALHSYGIVHRDLKLENILMDYKDMQTFTAKVIDFGLSQVITPLSKTKETYGTLIYCSPEILLNVPYNYKVDVWSLGVISFYLEYTFMPFGIRGKEAEQEISSKIIMGDLKFPRKVDSRNDQNEIRANKLMMMIIKRCLSKDINQRLTSRQMLSLLMEINSN
jgi:serine/threonine protein kinase